MNKWLKRLAIWRIRLELHRLDAKIRAELNLRIKISILGVMAGKRAELCAIKAAR